MNAVRNYQKELDKIISDIEAGRQCAPTLFLHSCCAPCSSYVLEYLRKYFRITVFYYNPNITEDEEYSKRVTEQKRLIAAYNEQLMRADGLLKETEWSNVYLNDRNMQDIEKRDTQEIKKYDIKGCGTQDIKKQDEEKQKTDNKGYNIDIIEGDYEPQRFYEIVRGLEECPEGGERCFACYALRLAETAKRAQAGRYDYFTTTLTISPLKNAAKLNEIGERLAKEYGITWLPSDFKKKNGYKRSVELSREYDLYRQDYCGCIYSRNMRN